MSGTTATSVNNVVRLSGPRPPLGRVAKATGVSESTVSRVLNGKFLGSAETVERVLAAAQQISEEMAAAGEFEPERGPLQQQMMASEPHLIAVQAPAAHCGYLTDKQLVMLLMLREIQECRSWGVLCAPSGFGKTHVAGRLCSEQGERVLYVPVSPLGPWHTTLDEILARFGESLAGQEMTRLKRVKRVLAERNVELLILDEADHFVGAGEARMNKRIHMARELWREGQGPGVAMVGLPKLATGVQGSADYLTSRITVRRTFEAPTPADMVAVWDAVGGPQMDKGDLAELLRVARQGGGYRMLKHLAKRITDGMSLEEVLGMYTFEAPK